MPLEEVQVFRGATMYPLQAYVIIWFGTRHYLTWGYILQAAGLNASMAEAIEWRMIEHHLSGMRLTP
jgi:hypothetical protein